MRRLLPKLRGRVEGNGGGGHSLLWASQVSFRLPRTSLDLQKEAHCRRLVSPEASPQNLEKYLVPGGHPGLSTHLQLPLHLHWPLAGDPPHGGVPALCLDLSQPRSPWEFSECPQLPHSLDSRPQSPGCCCYTGHTARSLQSQPTPAWQQVQVGLA